MIDVLRLVEEGIPTEFGVFCYLDDTRRMYVGETGVKLANGSADLVNRLIATSKIAEDFPIIGRGAEGVVHKIGMNQEDGTTLDTAVKIYKPDRLKGITQYVSHLRIPQKSEFRTPTPYFASDRVFAMELMDENALLTQFMDEHLELADEVRLAVKGVSERAEYGTVRDPQEFHLYVVEFNPEKKDLREKYKFAIIDQ